MKISQLALALCAAAALTPSAALRGDHRRAESIEADDKKGSESRRERTCSVNVGDTLYTSAAWVFGIGAGGLQPDRRLQEDGNANAAGTPVTADNAYSDEIATVWFPVFKFVNEDAEKVCVYGENIFTDGCYRRHLKEEDRNLGGYDDGFCAVPEDYIGGGRRYERKLNSYSPEELQNLKDGSERKLFSLNECGMELVGFMTADAAVFGVQYYSYADRKLGPSSYNDYDEAIPAASVDLNFLCLDDKDIECALSGGNAPGCKRGLSNIIKGSISASGLGAVGAPELFGEDNTDYFDYEPYGMGQFGITGGTNSFNNIQGGQINMDYVAPNTMRFEITGPTAAGSD